jgi:hypothetical protein
LDITSTADSGISWSHYAFSGVSSVCNRHAEGPGDCGGGVFVAEKVDGVGDKGSGDTTMLDAETL